MRMINQALRALCLICFTLEASSFLHHKHNFGSTVGSFHSRKSACLLGASKSSSEIPSNTKVIYQKVIRPSKVFPDILFLGYLVEYLERHFTLPTNLPMIYETSPANEESRSILSWDSPLSPSSDATKMEVEVVGIYTDQDEKKSASTPSLPNMAMVVVKKSKSGDDALPPMMKNLFSDSEDKIIKMLDRGLEDFIAGKIKFEEKENQSIEKKIPNIRTADEAIEAELLNEIPEFQEAETKKEDVVFDTYATSDPETPEVQAQEKEPVENKSTSKNQNLSPEAIKRAISSMQVSPEELEKPIHDSTEDFAVQAAKKAAKARSQKTEDFAVAAARKALKKKTPKLAKGSKGPQKKKQVIKSSTKATRGTKQVTSPEPVEVETSQEELQMDPSFKIPDYMGSARAFRTTISHPKDWMKKRRSKSSKTKKPKVQPATSEKKKNMKIVTEKSKSVKEVVDAGVVTEKEIESNRNINAKVMFTDKDEVARGIDPNDLIATSLEEKVDDIATKSDEMSDKMPSREQIELDVMKAAQEVMDDIAEQEGDMTPEELLRGILKFDEDKQKENEPGNGFVSGAFEKAKQILKDQHRERQTRLQENNPVNISPNIADPQGSVDVGTREISSEAEELRQMFEAGERIANGRMVQSKTEEASIRTNSGTTEEDIDELIRGEKTVSSYARVLDDELTELEVAINKSPGEELDGPMKNPMFDIMSGPEVYNPNVDPETVNYPGALPGTKDIKLPKELEEARKQAEFAVEVLTNLKVVENERKDGSKKEQYFMGKKELTKDQVIGMQRLVQEATQIGLINDPLNLMAERSRLQIILDELWNQPDERFKEIAESYKDLLLSDNFVTLIRERMTNMADRDLDALRRDDESLREPHARERKILGQLVGYAQVLLKETRALGAELEAQQIEVIRSICKVAMDPSHTTEEETAVALSDAVRDMRPLLDDVFVAYLKYAVAEEEARLARAGLLDDPEHNQWLFVLKIVQQGVYAEIAKGINRYIDHISYVIRMETPKQRRGLLSKLIDDMPTLDVRPFVQVVENIAGSLGDGARGEFDDVVELGEVTNKILQLNRDVKDLLPPERIALKSRDADEWAEKQRKRLLKSRKISEQRLKAARENAHLEEEIEALGRRGEMERIE